MIDMSNIYKEPVPTSIEIIAANRDKMINIYKGNYMSTIYREPGVASTDIIVSKDIDSDPDSYYLNNIPKKENLLLQNQSEYTEQEVFEHIEKINKAILKFGKKGERYAHYYLPMNKLKLAQKLLDLYKKQGYHVSIIPNRANSFLEDLFGKKSILMLFSTSED